jgi:hypothetical protein
LGDEVTDAIMTILLRVTREKDAAEEVRRVSGKILVASTKYRQIISHRESETKPHRGRKKPVLKVEIGSRR